MTIADLENAQLELDRAISTPELVRATTKICALKDPNAATTLIKVLSYNNPAVAATATQGLIELGREIVPMLLISLNTGNYGARAWIVKVLAALRDPRGLDQLEHALGADIAPSVRRSAARGLADLDLHDATASEELFRCCNGLFQACRDDEWIVRYAAVYGLERRMTSSALTQSMKDTGRSLLKQLSSEQEDVKVVRLRASLALQRLSIR